MGMFNGIKRRRTEKGKHVSTLLNNVLKKAGRDELVLRPMNLQTCVGGS